MRIEQALDRYVLHLRGNGRCDHTIGQVRRHARLFEEWFEGDGHTTALRTLTIARSPSLDCSDSAAHFGTSVLLCRCRLLTAEAPRSTCGADERQLPRLESPAGTRRPATCIRAGLVIYTKLDHSFGCAQRAVARTTT